MLTLFKDVGVHQNSMILLINYQFTLTTSLPLTLRSASVKSLSSIVGISKTNDTRTNRVIN